MEKKNIARAIQKSLNGGTRRQHVRWLYGFTALISVTMFILFWYTSVFHDTILSNLELKNGTSSFLLWQKPPVNLEIKIYVFNYTNVREFESGKATKLKVEEVGPFIYRENLSRVNVEIHENGTITYQERKRYQWISGKSENERVIVPNVMLMSTLAFSRNLSYLFQIGLTMFLSRIRAEPFLELSVGQYLWGYEDELYEVAKRFSSLRSVFTLDKFGLLAFNNGSSPDRITIHSETDNLGIIERINGIENHQIWGDEKCDRIYGTDGSMFPPHWINQPNKTLFIYAKDFCRKMPFHYDHRNFSNGIPTLRNLPTNAQAKMLSIETLHQSNDHRYKLSSNVFATRNKDSCFCPKESHDSTIRICPPTGTLNVSACNFGTPMIASFPHFYTGNESLFEKIVGLEPRQERHESYIDLHPRLGITVNMNMRLQMNVEVRKAVGIPFSGNLEDGLILPLIWLDTGIGEIPESLRQILYRSHYLVNAIEAVLQWCSLIGAIISFGALFATMKKERSRRRKESKERTKESIETKLDSKLDRPVSEWTETELNRL